jgi:hypothetical protein
VWADIESFLLRPEEILERLREHLLLQDRERPLRKKELAKLTAQRQQKIAERDRILALFRRGRIDEQILDQQLDLNLVSSCNFGTSKILRCFATGIPMPVSRT